MHRKSSLLVAIALLATMPWSSAQTADQAYAPGSISGISFATWVGQLDTLQSEYRQRIWSQSTGGGSTRGILLIDRRTAKYRLDVVRGEHIREVIIGDGKSLWHFDSDLAQATRYNLEDIGDTPIMLVSSDYQTIAAVYDISGSLDETVSGIFEFTAKDPDALVPNAVMRVEAGLPQRLQTLDSSGETGILYFINPVANQVVGDADFLPNWGDEVLLVDQSGFGTLAE